MFQIYPHLTQYAHSASTQFDLGLACRWPRRGATEIQAIHELSADQQYETGATLDAMQSNNHLHIEEQGCPVRAWPAKPWPSRSPAAEDFCWRLDLPLNMGILCIVHAIPTIRTLRTLHTWRRKAYPQHAQHIRNMSNTQHLKSFRCIHNILNIRPTHAITQHTQHAQVWARSIHSMRT